MMLEVVAVVAAVEEEVVVEVVEAEGEVMVGSMD